MNPFPPGSRIVAYLRDSGHDEQELSVSQQERRVRQWATENRLIVETIYADVARQGSSVVKRAKLQAMMHDFRRGTQVAGVVIWKWNRFARNVDNAQFYRAEIRTRGYVFHSLNDEIPEGPIGRVFEAILDYKDEQYVLDLSVDIQRGLHDLVQIYGCVPGTPPTGFRREPVIISYHRDGSPHTASRWVPDREIVLRLRRAFELYASGASIGQVHTETHLCKAINSYTTLFANQLYIGILEYGDQVIEDYCEPLIPKPIWDAVQARRQKAALHRSASSESYDHPRRTNSRYLLSGLARCTLCGSPLYGHTSRDKGRHGQVYLTESYYCSQAPRQRNCTRRRIPRLPFENAVLRELRDYILQPGFISTAYTLLANSHANQLAETDARLAELTGQLSSLHKQISRLTAAIAESGHSRAILDKLKILEQDETELLSRQSILQAQRQPVPEIPIERLADMLPAAAPLLVDGASDEQKRLGLRAFIHHVDVELDENTLRGVIWYYYPPADLTHISDPPPDDGTATDPDLPVSSPVPMDQSPPGAPVHRHVLPHPFTALARKKRPV